MAELRHSSVCIPASRTRPRSKPYGGVYLSVDGTSLLGRVAVGCLSLSESELEYINCSLGLSVPMNMFNVDSLLQIRDMCD